MITIKIMVIGDTHGGHSNFKHGPKNTMIEKIYKAGELKIQHIMVVGDFGLWTHALDGHVFLDEINQAAEINNLSIYAIGGNHENWDHWEKFLEFAPTHKGFGLVRSRVLLAPKAHCWTWDNKQFVSAGGAVSVDKEWRIKKEREKKRPRTLWWPNEELTDDHVREIESWRLEADYLFTHDCSNFTPFRDRLKPDPDSEIHRRRIDKVLRATTPRMHFHGHMHTKYAWENGLTYGNTIFDTEETVGPSTLTYGLECNDDWDSWGVLDTTKDVFLFRGREDDDPTPEVDIKELPYLDDWTEWED